MAELGTTDDVAALVPGDPGVLRETARALRDHAQALGDAAGGLARITTPEGWSGTAADAFRGTFDAQPPRWRDAATAFQDTSRAVDDHAAVMEWARGRAGEAVARWHQGEAASSTARTEYDRAVAGGAVGPFVDVGDPVRAEARQMLDEARVRLRESGDRSAAATTAACAAAPPGPGFWEGLADDAGAIAAQVGNAGASVGNAALHNVLDVGAMALGGGIVAVGAAGAVGSLALDATVVGLPAGLPLGGASVAAMAAGAGIAGAGAIDLAQHAIGDDRVAPFTVATDADAGEEAPLAPADRLTSVGIPGRQQNVRELPDEQAVEDLYAELAEDGTPVQWGNYAGQPLRLPDGTEIGLRRSTRHGSTIDIRLPNGEQWKVHIPH